MKRPRDDDGSQPTRPSLSLTPQHRVQTPPPSLSLSAAAAAAAVASPPPPYRSSTIASSLTVPDRQILEAAMKYLEEVKVAVGSDKYSKFVQLIADFGKERNGPLVFVLRVRQLFKDQPELAGGFNTFVPEEFQAVEKKTILEPEEHHAVENELIVEQMDIDSKEAVEKMAIHEPKTTIAFVPEEHHGVENETMVEQEDINFKEALGLVCKIKNHFHGDERHDSFLAILNKHRKGQKSKDEFYQELVRLFEGNDDLLKEFLRFLPCHLPSYEGSSMRRDRRRHAYGDKIAKTYDLDGDSDIPGDNAHIENDVQRRHIKKDARENMNASERDKGEKHFKCERRHSDRVKHRKRKRKHSQRVGDSGTVQLKQGREDAENSMLCRIQASPCSNKITSSKPDSDLDVSSSQRCTPSYPVELDENYKHPSKDRTTLDATVLNDENSSRCERRHSDHVKHHKRKHSQRVGDSGTVQLKQGREDAENSVLCRIQASPCSNKITSSKPASDLNVSSTPRCTPGYPLELDENYKRPSKDRTTLDASVLNDENSSRCERRAELEEILSKAEDYRFELDMILERLKATIRQVTGFLHKIEDRSIKPDEAKLEAYFTSANLRCMEVLYAEYGLDAMSMVRRNVSIAMPIILSRLKQKQEECELHRLDYEKAWEAKYRRIG